METTLQETLDFNRPENKAAVHPSARQLDWGEYLAAQLDQLLPLTSTTSTANSPDRILLGSDILYNPESHEVLLQTVLSFLRPDGTRGESRSKALIAYKARTEGDDTFFPLARDAGLGVKEVWTWGQVGVWELK